MNTQTIVKRIIKRILAESDSELQTILNIINQYGEFSTKDVEAEHSPSISTDMDEWHLVEYFYSNGVEVVVYDRDDESRLDSYHVEYEELDYGTLNHIYRLALNWKKIKS